MATLTASVHRRWFFWPLFVVFYYGGHVVLGLDAEALADRLARLVYVVVVEVK